MIIFNVYDIISTNSTKNKIFLFYSSKNFLFLILKIILDILLKNYIKNKFISILFLLESFFFGY